MNTLARVSDAGISTAPNDTGSPTTTTARTSNKTGNRAEIPRRRHGQQCDSTSGGDSINKNELCRTHLLNSLADYRQKAERAISAETLLGLEGMAAKTYFAGLFALLNGRHDFDVNDRNRRPPRDPVNAVLSFVYSLGRVAASSVSILRGFRC